MSTLTPTDWNFFWIALGLMVGLAGASLIDNVLIRLACWLGVWALFLALTLSLSGPSKTPPTGKGLISIGLTLALVGLYWAPAGAWLRAERARATSGYLIARDGNARDATGYPVVQFGPNGLPRLWTLDLDTGTFSQPTISIGPTDPKFKPVIGSMHMPADPQKRNPFGVPLGAPFFIEKGTNGIELSTAVYDPSGNLVATVIRNRWTVFPTFATEWNFTSDSFEVLDSRARPVLQVHLSYNNLNISGEWRDPNGTAVSYGSPDRPIAPGENAFEFSKKEHTDLRQHPARALWPMFRYPSSEHLGELSHGTTRP